MKMASLAKIQDDLEALQAVFGLICYCPCAEDLNGDGTVNAGDLLILKLLGEQQVF